MEIPRPFSSWRTHLAVSHRWEIMALTAYWLVSLENEQPETRDAGGLYFIMSHIDAGCIVLGFLILFQASADYSFDSLRGIGATMSPAKRGS